MTLKQQRDKDMEEFDRLSLNLAECELPEEGKSSRDYFYHFSRVEMAKLKESITQIYINIAKGEIERLETLIKSNTGIDSIDARFAVLYLTGELTRWQDQLNSLTKE